MSGRRTPAEDVARTQCRSLCHALGTRLRKTDDRRVEIFSCRVWPQGLTTAFHGWVDLHERLLLCRSDPDLIIDGVYVPEEMEAAE